MIWLELVNQSKQLNQIFLGENGVTSPMTLASLVSSGVFIMVKRFSETTKWDDPWYRKLDAKHKCIWQFLCDRCDNAGVWKKDYDLASFLIGENFEEKDLESLNNGKERIMITKEHLILKDFLKFQIVDMHSDREVKGLTNLQKSCVELINRHIEKGIITTSTLPVGYKYLSDIGKDKDKGNNKGKGGVKVTTDLTKEETKEVWDES